MSKLKDQVLNMACSSSLYDECVLEWMEEATRRIEELTEQVRGLERTLASRTEHLA